MTQPRECLISKACGVAFRTRDNNPQVPRAFQGEPEPGSHSWKTSYRDRISASRATLVSSSASSSRCFTTSPMLTIPQSPSSSMTGI